MKRIDDRTVEFTMPGEVTAHEKFNDLLDEGKGIAHAAILACGHRNRSRYWTTWASPEFIEYLSDGTLTMVRTRHGREVMASGPFAAQTKEFLRGHDIHILRRV